MKSHSFIKKLSALVLGGLMAIGVGIGLDSNSFGNSKVEAGTGSYSGSMPSGWSTSGGTMTINSVSWKYSSATYLSCSSGTLQIGSKNNPQNSDWTISTDISSISSNILAVTSVSFKGKTGGSGTYDISVGGSSRKSGNLTTSDTTYTASNLSVASGAIVITLTASSKAMYLSSISVSYTTSEPVTGVSLNKESTTIEVGNSQTLIATIEPENATNKNINWSSNDSTIATVSNGVVKGINVGTTTITATTEDGGKTAECSVNVISGEPSVKISPLDNNVFYFYEMSDEQKNIELESKSFNCDDGEFVWKSSSQAIETIQSGDFLSEGSYSFGSICVKNIGTIEVVCSIVKNNQTICSDSITIEVKPETDKIADLNTNASLNFSYSKVAASDDSYALANDLSHLKEGAKIVIGAFSTETNTSGSFFALSNEIDQSNSNERVLAKEQDNFDLNSPSFYFDSSLIFTVKNVGNVDDTSISCSLMCGDKYLIDLSDRYKSGTDTKNSNKLGFSEEYDDNKCTFSVSYLNSDDHSQFKIGHTLDVSVGTQDKLISFNATTSGGVLNKFFNSYAQNQKSDYLNIFYKKYSDSYSNFNPSMRFGCKIDSSLYDALSLEKKDSIEFGVAVTNDGTIPNSTSPQRTIDPVRVNSNGELDDNGDFYQFALVIIDIPDTNWNTVINARVFVKIDGVYYFMQMSSQSVTSLTEIYATAADKSSYAEHADAIDAFYESLQSVSPNP